MKSALTHFVVVSLAAFTCSLFLLSSAANAHADNTAEGEFYNSDGAGRIQRIGYYRNWRQSWAQIVPGHFGGDGYTDLLFYDKMAGEGEFYLCDGSGHISGLRRYRNWRKSWHQIVPGNFDRTPSQTDLLFYDQNAGVGEFYTLDGSGGMTLLRRYTNWRKTWDLIVPGNYKAYPGEFASGPYTDLLFYDRETGVGEIYATDGAGGLNFLKRYTNWRKSWTMIVPGNFSRGELYYTDLLFYDRLAGEGEFYSTDGSGELGFIKKYDNWRRTWSKIVPGNFGGTEYSDLLFYDSSVGRGEFYTTDGRGNLGRLRTYSNWRRTWDKIIPGHFGVAGETGQITDLLFYDQRIDFVPDWKDISVSPLDNISEDGIHNPVLTAADVNATDPEGADFVADPFIFYENDMWYMFFEVAKWNGTTHFGRIGLATSYNGIDWEYDRTVLHESTHHSYPLVIRVSGKHYMITESYVQNEIRFYEAKHFPYNWERVYTINKCGSADVPTPGQCIDTGDYPLGDLDPSIFKYNDTLWLFSGEGSNGFLYCSDTLLSGWQNHPANPIVTSDASKSRPGGRAMVYDTDHIIRFAQKRDIRYGQRVRAFAVNTLTRTEYSEEHDEIAGGAPFCTDGGVFCETGSSDQCGSGTSCADREDRWNLCGMHNFDAWWTGEYWLIVADGYKCLSVPNDWSIGIFISRPR